MATILIFLISSTDAPLAKDNEVRETTRQQVEKVHLLH